MKSLVRPHVYGGERDLFGPSTRGHRAGESPVSGRHSPRVCPIDGVDAVHENRLFGIRLGPTHTLIREDPWSVPPGVGGRSDLG